MPDLVQEACAACFADHKDDCSGFARAVAARLGVRLTGLANDIVGEIGGDGGWTRLTDGIAAERSAAAGKLVIGGLRGDDQADPDPHGHVVVVVAGLPLAHDKYPFAYWGRLHGGGREDETINEAWRAEDRDNVTYAAHDIAAAATS